jgi:outer membrane protein assembly factor BamB
VGDVATVRALDVATGAQTWSTPLGGFAAGLGAGPTVIAVQVPPGGSNPDGSPLPGELVALSPDDGAVMWRRPFGGYSPVTSGGLVAAYDQSQLAAGPNQSGLPPGAGVTVVAFDAGTGSVVWERELPRVFPGPSLTAVGDLLVYSDSSSPDAALAALDARSGEDRWRTEHANPAVDEDHPSGSSYFQVHASPDGAFLVGLIPAEAPYRD